MKEILLVIFKFFRGIVRFIALLVVAGICELIYFITYEKGTKGVLTARKAGRIRRLTHFKLFMLDHFPHTLHFLGFKDNVTELKKELNYGL